MRLTATHHVILWCAVEDLDLATPLLGMDEVIGSGESFPLVRAVPADDARLATLELLAEGALRVSYFDPQAGSGPWLDQDQAHAVLSDPATWDLNRSEPLAYSYEISLTAVGETLLTEAQREFGHEMERSMNEARAASAEFLRRHPDFVKRNARYLREMTRWVITGRGEQPKPPRFD